MKTRIEKLANFLNEKYSYVNGGVYSSESLAGDERKLVYDEDGIEVKYCPEYDYLEILRLTEEEWKTLSSLYHPKSYLDSVFKEEKIIETLESPQDIICEQFKSLSVEEKMKMLMTLIREYM